jgi:hypothetical protein
LRDINDAINPSERLFDSALSGRRMDHDIVATAVRQRAAIFES